MGLQILMVYLDLMASRFASRTPAGWRRLACERSGQSMVEYAIVAALIALVAMAAVQALGGGVAQVFQNILGKIRGIA